MKGEEEKEEEIEEEEKEEVEEEKAERTVEHQGLRGVSATRPCMERDRQILIFTVSLK